MPNAYIALGSNLGNRLQYLQEAIDSMRRLPTTSLVKTATPVETAPVDSPADAGPYMNTVTHLHTFLEPRALLKALLTIERGLGRDRSAREQNAHRHAPRTLDLDIVLYDDLVLSTPELVVPHPRMHLRRFVLQPLAEIAPDVVHPILHKTVRSLLQTLEPDAL